MCGGSESWGVATAASGRVTCNESACPLIELEINSVLTGVGGRRGMDEGECVEGLKAGAWLPPLLDA